MTVSSAWTPTGRTMCACRARPGHRGHCPDRHQIVHEHVTAAGGVAWLAPQYAPGVSATREGAAGHAPASALPAHPPTANARNTDPAPAHDAARKVNVHGDTWLVLREHVEAGESGLTGDDLAAVTGRPYESVGPRRPWLVEQGWVAATGDRRGGKGVYVATPAGVAAWKHQREAA